MKKQRLGWYRYDLPKVVFQNHLSFILKYLDNNETLAHRYKSRPFESTHLWSGLPSVCSSCHDLIVDVNCVFLHCFIIKPRSSPRHTGSPKIAKFEDSVLLHISQNPCNRYRDSKCIHRRNPFLLSGQQPYGGAMFQYPAFHGFGRSTNDVVSIIQRAQLWRTYWLPWICVNVPPEIATPLEFDSKPVDDVNGGESVNAYRIIRLKYLPWIFYIGTWRSLRKHLSRNWQEDRTVWYAFDLEMRLTKIPGFPKICSIPDCIDDIVLMTYS